MGSKAASDHGMALDSEDKRVQCNYCGKIVPGFNRLEQHLGGVGKDVLECHEAPVEIKESFRKMVIQRKIKKLTREVGDVQQTTICSRRSLNTSKKKVVNSTPRDKQGSRKQGRKRALYECEKDKYGHLIASCSNPKPSFLESPNSTKEEMNSMVEYGFVASLGGLPTSNKDYLSFTMEQTKRTIARFFIENGIDLVALGSSSFQRIIEMAQYGGGMRSLTRSQMPTIRDVEGWILCQEHMGTENHVEEMKQWWKSSGCSVLLDEWSDNSGRYLMNVLVNNIMGTVYLCSMDITTATRDPNVIELLVHDIVQQVGVHDVVQVIFNTTSSNIEVARKQLSHTYKSLFFHVSISHCMELMLQDFLQIDFVKDVMDRAKNFTKFIYGHTLTFNLMLKHMSQRHIVKVSTIKVAIPFLILENMLVEIGNIIDMFVSPDWRHSDLAQTVEGMSIVNLVTNDVFWVQVVVVLQAVNPLINALFRINKENKPHMGDIYGVIKEIKEDIRKELGHDKLIYEPFWRIIDEIYDKIFSSSLHTVSYFLNPRNYYEKSAHAQELNEKMLSTIMQMVGDEQTLQLIVKQLESYCWKLGAFKIGSEMKELSHDSPVEWWFRFGGDYPELQKLAIKILSQTCKGGSSFGLKRKPVEMVLSNGINCIEKQRMEKLIYIQFNLKLKQLKLGKELDCEDDEVDPLNDWI